MPHLGEGKCGISLPFLYNCSLEVLQEDEPSYLFFEYLREEATLVSETLLDSKQLNVGLIQRKGVCLPYLNRVRCIAHHTRA